MKNVRLPDGAYKNWREGWFEGQLSTIEWLIHYMSNGNNITIDGLRKTFLETAGLIFKEKYGSYKNYLQSQAWKDTADFVKNRAGWKCQRCGISGDDSSLHAHHLTYDRVGRELAEDLMVLCADCHANAHGKD